MYNYRYDLIGAYIDYHIHKHPQDDLNDKGLKWIKCEPFSIADCWIFRFDKPIESCPPYLTRISDNFKFSDERSIK